MHLPSCLIIRWPVSVVATRYGKVWFLVDVVGDDSSLSGAVVATFNDKLNSKLKALTQSLHQLKDANRYTQKCQIMNDLPPLLLMVKMSAIILCYIHC